MFLVQRLSIEGVSLCLVSVLDDSFLLIVNVIVFKVATGNNIVVLNAVHGK